MKIIIFYDASYITSIIIVYCYCAETDSASDRCESVSSEGVGGTPSTGEG